ncbi:MAG TPA: hypothetical protein DIT13_06430 [Verrucomicrobiales bacterium]|nr:hypothetical protein [Verrucomicrobiales bacterium]
MQRPEPFQVACLPTSGHISHASASELKDPSKPAASYRQVICIDQATCDFAARLEDMNQIFFAPLLAIAAAHALEPLPLMDVVVVNGIEISAKSPPKGLVLDKHTGLLTVEAVQGRVVHRTQTRILETRATITPRGDYLLMFPEGDHYAKSKGEKINSMMACRSTDKGKTWSKPAVAYDIPYGQHGFIPLTPRGTQTIHCFGTQPVPGKWTWEDGKRENAPIGWRTSEDDGHTWSDVRLIEPVNDPGFMGMSVMRMTETDAGTWLLGSHLADWSVKPFTTRQYLLRSEDKGKTWSVLPGARPKGWQAAGFNRMDEGRPLNLGGGKVLFMSRTPQGHLFTAWSQDDGKTWTDPAPSTLVHPDAPPMLFPLSDGKTLVAFHHNKVPVTNHGDLNDHSELMRMRSEIWASLSTDEGRTWSEPRFMLANAVAPVHKVSGFNSQCSYLDAFTEDGVMHLFMPHRWQQVLHLTIKESALKTLPTKAQLLAKQAGSESASVPLMETFPLAGRELNPAAPPLGLKTYSDLGLMIEESILGYELTAGQPAPPPAAAAASDTDTTGRMDPGAADLSVLTPLETTGGSLVFPL